MKASSRQKKGDHRFSNGYDSIGSNGDRRMQEETDTETRPLNPAFETFTWQPAEKDWNRNNSNTSSKSSTNGHSNDHQDIEVNPSLLHQPKKPRYLPEAKVNTYTNNEEAAQAYFRRKSNRFGVPTILVSLLALALCIIVLTWSTIYFYHSTEDDDITSLRYRNNYNNNFDPHSHMTPYKFDNRGRYLLPDYDVQTAFSDFLPGLAGIYGKPMYAFFVNRGQGIAAFGTKSKEYPIMEFQSANKAYQLTPLVGFRTFIQGQRKSTSSRGSYLEKSFLIEPFSPLTANYHASDFTKNPSTTTMGDPPSTFRAPKRYMYSGDNEMQIQEIDFEQRLETNVTYFILPEEDFGAFVRRTTITNLDSHEDVTISVLDGLARMEPAGGALNSYLKDLGETLQSFMGVYFPYADSITMPFYRLSEQPADTDQVKVQERGHYCLSFLEKPSGERGDAKLLPIIYDTSKVFGEDTSLLRPTELFQKRIGELIENPQYGQAKTSSCFGALDKMTIKPGEIATITSFYGAADHILEVPVIARRIIQEAFALYKLTRTREVIHQITGAIETRTSHKLFDSHAEQMYLDNTLRGGIPLILGSDNDDGMDNVDEDHRLKVFHVFSRIHGDLERDYNDFMLGPTFFSQGPGNFRDIIQNRREDVFFNPRIASFNVRMFLSFIQADGYQPLSVEAIAFSIRDKDACIRIAEQVVGRADGHRAQREALIGILNGGPFRPGQLFSLIESQNVELIVSRQLFIDMVASAADSWPMAVYKQGYWADHWTYYMDMIQSYLSIYPDGEAKLLFETQLPYFFSPATVQPRHKKYIQVLTMNGDSHHIQQSDATIEDEDKINAMDPFRSNTTGWYDYNASWQKKENGHHFKSTVVAKLLLLATLKFATRDVYGMGIEYEAGKPGWDDANNGLPSMLGSGIAETFELKVLVQYLCKVIAQYERSITIPQELSDLMEAIDNALDSLVTYIDPKTLREKVPTHLFDYWNNVSSARELYRERTRVTFSGQTVTVTAASLDTKLKRWLQQIDVGISRAIKFGTSQIEGVDQNIAPTYFAFEVTKFSLTGDYSCDGHPLVNATQMRVKRLPVFLEGPTRMMKTISNRTDAQQVYSNIREHSGLRDETLGMYTISSQMKGQTANIGRTMAFPPGWGENQGVSLHMSYKFYLELLRHGLHQEFFNEATSGGFLPFMDSQVYGRSLTECSSYIVSSAFEDPSKRGRGILARLSGSTVEFLSIWKILFVGPSPFIVDSGDNHLRMQLIPSLPLWMFETLTADNFEEDPNIQRDALLQYALTEHPNVPTIRFKLFSSINVQYFNERKTDLFGISPSRYRVGLRDGTIFDIEGATIGVDLADKIRRVVFVEFIEAFFE